MAQFDVMVVGTALNTFGFTAKDTIAGLGLNTFGFVWPCDAIWSPAYDVVTTTWSDCADLNPNTNVESCLD